MAYDNPSFEPFQSSLGPQVKRNAANNGLVSNAARLRLCHPHGRKLLHSLPSLKKEN